MVRNTCTPAKSSQKPSPANAHDIHGNTDIPLDLPLMGLGLDRHRIECPHCQKQTVRFWPGKMILFARMGCKHCSMEFLVLQNEATR